MIIDRIWRRWALHGIGIIGMGTMGMRMADAMEAHPCFRVIAAFDPARRWDNSTIERRASIEAVVNDAKVSCVYIASPPASHAQHIRAAVAAGKAIFCEKPLASTINDAKLSTEIVSRSRTFAALNFPLATAPAALELQEIVSQGKLGRLTGASLKLRFRDWPRAWQASATWLAQPKEGGFMREVASHFVFLANRCFGSGILADAYVETRPGCCETAVRATVIYPQVELVIDAALAGENDDFNRFEVCGDRGSAAITDWYRLEHRGAVSDRTLPMPFQLARLDGMLRGMSDHGLATFEEGLRVARYRL